MIGGILWYENFLKKNTARETAGGTRIEKSIIEVTIFVIASIVNSYTGTAVIEAALSPDVS